MKKQSLLIVSFFLVQVSAFAQSKVEKEIRDLDQLEMTSIYKRDTIAMLQLWDKNFVVNNPYDVIVTVPEIIGFIRKGEIDYATASRITEKVTFNKNIAITMGREILTQQRAAPNAGKNIEMRYTHIWMKNKKGWTLVARQATNFSV